MAHDTSPLQGQKMSQEGIEKMLKQEGIGVLSMASEGTPYSIPISFGYDDDRLYFLLVGHSEQGRKMRFAEWTEEASFLVFNVNSDSGWRSAIVSGPLDRITPGKWDRAREAMADNAYRPDLLTAVDVQADPRVWELTITEKSGRAVGTR